MSGKRIEESENLNTKLWSFTVATLFEFSKTFSKALVRTGLPPY